MAATATTSCWAATAPTISPPARAAHLVLGDNGDFVFTNGLPTYFTTTDASEATGGNDVINAGNGDNVVLGGVGADTITAGTGNDVIIGDNGNMTFTLAGILTYATTADVTLGGADVITAGAGNNAVLGGSGGDTITSLQGDDIVIGDDGNITYTSAGVLDASADQRSQLRRQRHHQRRRRQQHRAGRLRQRQYHHRQRQRHGGGRQMARVTLVSGIRSIVTSTDADSSTAGNDTISLGAGQDQAIGGYGSDTIMHVSGEAVMIGDDGTIISDATGRATISYTGNPLIGGNDTIIGGSDRDVIFGGAGADDLVGNDGNDIIIGDGQQGDARKLAT